MKTKQPIQIFFLKKFCKKEWVELTFLLQQVKISGEGLVHLTSLSTFTSKNRLTEKE